VDRLRDDVIPPVTQGTDVDVKVGGITAGATDYSNYTAERLPVFIGLVLLLSFLLLMVVFRSVLVPLKAVIMNLLSIGAAYGVIVAVFQWGWLKDLIGVAESGPIEAWVPMMLFAIVFGLSMDYEVFLLSRMKEEYDRTGNNATGWRTGSQRPRGSSRRRLDHDPRLQRSCSVTIARSSCSALVSRLRYSSTPPSSG
jgi:RND superfamily putative drug exporter